MAHSLGAIKFADNQIRYFEYDGTADVVISKHYATAREVADNWRKHIWVRCQCGKTEPVSLFTSYGGGFYIDGVACRHCESVESYELDFDYIERSETIDWANQLPEFTSMENVL